MIDATYPQAECAGAPSAPTPAAGEMTAGIPGIWMSVSCRQCGHGVTQINAGRTDGVRSTCSVKCLRCRREYVLVAEMAATHLPSTGAA